MNWKHYVGIILTALANGAGAWAVQHLTADGVPTSSQQWSAFVVGALSAGLVAVGYLFQDKPEKATAPTGTGNAVALVLALGIGGYVTIGCQGCGSNPPPVATVISDVAEIDASVCKLVKDLAGDGMPGWVEIVCPPLQQGAIAPHYKIPRSQWQAAEAAAVDGGGF